MKRAAIYSSTVRGREAPSPAAALPHDTAAANPPAGWLPRLLGRNRTLLVFVAGALAAALVGMAIFERREAAPAVSQEDIDAAVQHTLEKGTLPSRASRAAAAVRQSVVRVTSYSDEEKNPASEQSPSRKKKSSREKASPGDKGTTEKKAYGVGSGVVILDTGVILTNLHVVQHATRIVVTFFDGFESEAEIVAFQPDNDLAVIRAKTIPDDLPAATIGSTQGLRPGDEVVAVGFPFGIGPSVSAGVISGLNREFTSPKGQRVLSRLIQFDAAANPGNSGGPLVTMGGEVVGIVTAILNPTEAGTFVGIGFAATIETAGRAIGVPPF